MHDVRDIELAMHDIWLSLHEAAAVANCIPMVAGDAGGQDERVLALAGAVSSLLVRARERVEAAEADLKRADRSAGTAAAVVAVAMAA